MTYSFDNQGRKSFLVLERSEVGSCFLPRAFSSVGKESSRIILFASTIFLLLILRQDFGIKAKIL
jgi:hypothetical protein